MQKLKKDAFGIRRLHCHLWLQVTIKLDSAKVKQKCIGGKRLLGIHKTPTLTTELQEQKNAPDRVRTGDQGLS